MIRLYRIMVEQLLLAVMFLHSQDHKPGDVYSHTIRRVKDLGEDGSMFRDLRNYGGPDTWQELIDKLTLLLRDASRDHATARDGDLIDTVVRILQLPHARNNLTGKTLENLRKAILMPDELGKLLDVKRLESCCGHCGHRFLDGEMVTAHFDGGCVFMCAHCYTPTSIRCTVCKDGVSPVADKLKVLLSKVTCGCNRKPPTPLEGDVRNQGANTLPTYAEYVAATPGLPPATVAWDIEAAGRLAPAVPQAPTIDNEFWTAAERITRIRRTR